MLKRIALYSLLMFLVSSLCFANQLPILSLMASTQATPSTTTYTYGAYELTGLNVDSHSGNTSITSSGLNGGGPAGDWTGFKVTITAGTGSGSAVISGWDDDTDTITVGAGLSDVTDNDTFSVVCQYATVGSGNLQDCAITTIYSNKHFSAGEGNRVEYDVTGSSYYYELLYVPFVGNGPSGGATINTATLYMHTADSFLTASCTVAVGKMVDESVSPNSTVWDYTGTDVYNDGATYEYKDDGITLDWEADSSNNFLDILSAVEVTATVAGTDDNVWKSWNIQPIVEDYVTDGNTNIGMYVRNTTDDRGYVYFESMRNSTTTDRWIVVINYTE